MTFSIQIPIIWLVGGLVGIGFSLSNLIGAHQDEMVRIRSGENGRMKLVSHTLIGMSAAIAASDIAAIAMGTLALATFRGGPPPPPVDEGMALRGTIYAYGIFALRAVLVSISISSWMLRSRYLDLYRQGAAEDPYEGV